jgi:diketogulonate reductase-like aldo/keto reductase
MAGATEKAIVQDAAIEEIELDDDEMKELDQLQKRRASAA